MDGVYQRDQRSGVYEDSDDPNPKNSKICGAFIAVFTLGALVSLAGVAGYYQFGASSNDNSNDTLNSCSEKGIWEPDTQLCECFPCVSGDSCENTDNSSSCVVDASAGQTYLFEEFWMNYTGDRDTTGQAYQTALTYRVPYQVGGILPPDGKNLSAFDGLLNQAIRGIHKKWQNAATDGYYIVYANGLSQIEMSIFFALASKMQRKMQVFEQIPYRFGRAELLQPTTSSYITAQGYLTSEPIFNPNLLVWNTSELMDSSSVIEVVCLPSDPAGIMVTPIYPDATHVYDLSEYWPHLTSESNQSRQDDVMYFSLTHLTGHASARFAWALIKDELLANTMWDYITRNNLYISAETRRRTIVTLNTLLNDGEYFMKTLSDVLTGRWTRLVGLLDGGQTRFGLKGKANTATLYLEMKVPAEQDPSAAAAVFASVGIEGRPGTDFGDTGTFSLNLLLHNHIFELFFSRLRSLMYDTPPRSVDASKIEIYHRE